MDTSIDVVSPKRAMDQEPLNSTSKRREIGNHDQNSKDDFNFMDVDDSTTTTGGSASHSQSMASCSGTAMSEEEEADYSFMDEEREKLEASRMARNSPEPEDD